MSRLSDAQAAEAIAVHHVELSCGIRRRLEALETAARAGGPFEDARAAVLDYPDREVLPHAAAEEQVRYPAGNRGRTAPVRAVLDEHRAVVAHVDRLRAASDGVGAAVTASAVLALVPASPAA